MTVSFATTPEQRARELANLARWERDRAADLALTRLDTRLQAAVRLRRLTWTADPLYRAQRHHDGPAHDRRIAAALNDATTELAQEGSYEHHS